MINISFEKREDIVDKNELNELIRLLKKYRPVAGFCWSEHGWDMDKLAYFFEKEIYGYEGKSNNRYSFKIQ